MKLEGVVTHGIELNAVGCVSNEVVIAFGPIGSYVDMSQFYTMEQTDALLDDKADKVDTYTKDETDALLDTKADKSTTYTKDEVDEMMSNVDTEPTEGSTNFVTSGGVFNALEQKVDKIPGKGLSSHDFTSAYKTKLIGIEEGAERNIIERIYVNGYLLPVENKNVNIPAATNTMAGVMSASDKRKLNEMLSAVVVKVSDRYGTYEADKTLTDLDIAISQGRDVLYIVNNAYYYRMSFYVPTQCVIAVRMNLNEPMMDNAKASYLYHSITGVTVNSLELASVADLPTDLSDLTNDVGFITSQALANYADGAEYDSTTHYIYLKHGNTRLPNPINAADFIKDGMVETVTIGRPESGPNAGVDCLIVTFNTDAGESPIELPLTQIFDPTNYYTKAEVDTALGSKANSADLASVATSGSYNDLSNKPTIPTVPTNVSAFTNDVGYLTTETDPTVPNHVKGITQQNITNWNNKADSSDLANYYTKSEVNSALGGKQIKDFAIDISANYNQESNVFSNLVFSCTMQDIIDAYNANKRLYVHLSVNRNTELYLHLVSVSVDIQEGTEGVKYFTFNSGDEYGSAQYVCYIQPILQESYIERIILQEKVTDIATIRSGAALGATAYQKPNGGIPKSDLASSVQTSLGLADSALQQHQDLSSYADGAEYDSSAKKIYLKHGNTRLNNPIDATAFIKDGMIDTVTVTNGNLVISFNTDAGKQPISLPISSIFNANNYYTKTEINNKGYLTSETDPVFGASVAAGIKSTDIANWNAKQSAIADLDDIRTGASLGATALQSYTETDPTVPSWAKQPNKPTYTASEVGALPSTTQIPSKTSDLTNDSGFITGYTETDPTVPAWAKASSKPTYTASEVGALPDTTVIPSKTSDLTNDSGFVTGSKMYIGTCDTAAATNPKDCTVETFPLNNGEPLDGTTICVRFAATDTSTSTSPTLNVNNTGAKRIWYNNALLAAAKSSLHHGYANRYIYYVYDSSLDSGNGAWVWLGCGYDSNTTYTNASLGQGYAEDTRSSAVAAVTASISSYSLTVGGVVSIHFAYDVPANATLNIRSRGAKAIYYKNAPITAGVIKAGDTATFIYTTYYHLISIDRSDGADLTNYYTKSEVDTALSGKQATLVSGTNLKTVNSTSLLGSGNVSVQPTLVSGTNIKTINNESLLGSGNITIQGGGSSVQSDWNQTDTMASDYIKNKPEVLPISYNSSRTSLEIGTFTITLNGAPFKDANNNYISFPLRVGIGDSFYAKCSSPLEIRVYINNQEDTSVVNSGTYEINISSVMGNVQIVTYSGGSND